MASHVQLYLWSVERLSTLALLFSLTEAKEGCEESGPEHFHFANHTYRNGSRPGSSLSSPWNACGMQDGVSMPSHFDTRETSTRLSSLARKEKKGTMMASQATEFATTFDRLGRRMLAQLESLPQGVWDWVPPNVPGDSLLTLATRFLEESEYLVLVTIGGQKRGDEHMVGVSPPNECATLLPRYERWVTQMHRLLGRLPDAIMNLLVAVPAPYREIFGAESITVRACLLYALEQSGLLVGRIECLGNMVAASDPNQQEVSAVRDIDGRPDRRESDTRDNDGCGTS